MICLPSHHIKSHLTYRHPIYTLLWSTASQPQPHQHHHHIIITTTITITIISICQTKKKEPHHAVGRPYSHRPYPDQVMNTIPQQEQDRKGRGKAFRCKTLGGYILLHHYIYTYIFTLFYFVIIAMSCLGLWKWIMTG